MVLQAEAKDALIAAEAATSCSDSQFGANGPASLADQWSNAGLVQAQFSKEVRTCTSEQNGLLESR